MCLCRAEKMGTGIASFRPVHRCPLLNYPRCSTRRLQETRPDLPRSSWVGTRYSTIFRQHGTSFHQATCRAIYRNGTTIYQKKH